MPHSALQAGQYREWRTGRWTTHNGLRSLSVDFGFKTAWDLEKLEPNTFFPIVSSVVFARRTGEVGEATPLTGHVEQWLGETGTGDIHRVKTGVSNISALGGSPYGDWSRQGASIVPRCLFFVNETESTAIVRARHTITVNPRRGSQDKSPWKTLDLTDITNQAIETQHVHNVHLGETVVPYATTEPLKAVLPIRRADSEIHADPDGVGGIGVTGLERRMRERWRTISELWEQNKRPVNNLDLLGQLDYLHKMSSQLEWQRDPGPRPVRVGYTKSGKPTAAILKENETVVDHLLFWVTRTSVQEGHYLLGIINSSLLYELVKPLMSKGQFGARDLHKHLWKLPIPEFDSDEPLHAAISDAGQAAAEGVTEQLSQLRQQRNNLTVTIARREILKWLADSQEGRAVETLVGELLSQ